MRKSLLAVAVSAAAAMLAVVAPSTAKADMPVLAAFNVTSLASLSPSWTVLARFDLGFRMGTDETSTSRRHYEVMASLPKTETVVNTYSVKPLVDTVTNQKVKLADAVTLTLISGKSILVADVYRTQLSVTPTSFGGGVFTVGGAF